MTEMRGTGMSPPSLPLGSLGTGLGESGWARDLWGVGIGSGPFCSLAFSSDTLREEPSPLPVKLGQC